MITATKSRSILRRRLLAWWDAGHRPLPWRFAAGAADPYRVWISEVMLQQTRVDAVVPYYRRFVERFPSMEALAAAREEEVVAAWSGLGYYARARRLRAAAREALLRHGGLPPSREALVALPGFGPYTAGAVASIAFGLSEPCVDGNVARVLARLFLVEDPPDTAQGRRRIDELAAGLVPRRRGARSAGGPARAPRASPADRPGDFNQALMELGATVCGKPVPACSRCPLARFCEARRAGREREIPAPRARARREQLVLACAVLERRGSVLLDRRAGEGLLTGLWELPNEAVAPGEDAPSALRRRFGREGLEVRVGEMLGRVERTLTHRELTLVAHRCVGAARRGVPARGGMSALRLHRRDALEELPMSAAMRALLHQIRPWLGRPDGPRAP